MRWCLLVLCTLVLGAKAWDDGDLEVFDVVEEVNQNFYELIGVAQDASPSEIKSAFKKLTLKLHPDKNDSPDADVQFRNLVSVHNILKDPGKRENVTLSVVISVVQRRKEFGPDPYTNLQWVRMVDYGPFPLNKRRERMNRLPTVGTLYNEVLKNGLPNWRSAIYYYRHVRKMGLAEGSIILFIIITFGQYAVGWAAYAEKRFTAEQILNSRGKKHSKKAGFDQGLSEILDQLPKPSVKDTLPFQIPRCAWWMVTAIPYGIIELRRRLKEQEEEAKRQKKREEDERARADREAAAAAEAKAAGVGVRKRRGFVPPARDADCLLDAADEPEGGPVVMAVKQPVTPLVTGGLWTDDDLAELVRLVKKYPGGSAERWERIAEAMCRSVPEVTHMAAKMKENCYKIPGQEPEVPVVVEAPKKVKTRKAEETSSGNWSQTQQKALENALAKYPKGGAGDRWLKIANTVPGKTKEECMQRCKYLSDMVRRQKQKEEEEAQQNAEGDVITEDQQDEE